MIRLKTSRFFAILFVFLSEILAETVFLGKNLDEHDDEEKRPDKQSLPGPEPDHETGKIDKGACKHRIAVETVGTVRHEMLRAQTDLLAERVHGIALAAGLHIGDSPYAEAQASEYQNAGTRSTERADMNSQFRRAGYQPHDGRQKENEEDSPQGVTCYITEIFHTTFRVQKYIK